MSWKTLRPIFAVVAALVFRAPAFAGQVEDEIRANPNVVVAQSVGGPCIDFQIHYEVLKKGKWVAKKNPKVDRKLTCALSLFQEYSNGRRSYSFFDSHDDMITFAGVFDVSRNKLDVDRVYDNSNDPIENGITGLCGLVQGNGTQQATKKDHGNECYAELKMPPGQDRVVYEVIQKIQSINKIKDRDDVGASK